MRPVSDRAAGSISRGAGVAGSLALHGAVLLSFVTLGRVTTHPRALPAYRVQLLAAPRADVASDQPTPGVTQPAPAPAPAPTPPPPAPKPATRPAAKAPAHAVAPAPAPAPAPPAAPKTMARPAPSPTSAPSAAPAPPAATSPNTTAASGTGTDAATIKTEGVDFPFPGYLRNLVAQVYRRWRPPSGNADLDAEMLFFVHRDGTISGLQFVRRSGSFAFDLEAQGAVEAAARANAFGTLPAGYGPDVLPVSFFFKPGSMR